MTVETASKPVVAIVIGDPCGIGPEVAVRAWHSADLRGACRPVLIGNKRVVEDAVALCGRSTRVVSLSDQELRHAGINAIGVLEPVDFDPDCVVYGQDVAACGRACGQWLEYADRLARENLVAGVVMGPISSGAMAAAGTLGTIATNKEDPAFLLLQSGRLAIVHLTDHIPFVDIPRHVSSDAVSELIIKTHGAFEAWGMPNPRIGVAGLNPHAEGDIEDREIRPAIERAKTEGVDAAGPVSPDSIFRHCVEGRYDIVLALYHDQGHIAMKTWGFSGNNVVMLGPDYILTTVAHGVAYEIAGKGVADHSMLLNAALTAASLASGRGFVQ